MSPDPTLESLVDDIRRLHPEQTVVFQFDVSATGEPLRTGSIAWLDEYGNLQRVRGHEAGHAKAMLDIVDALRSLLTTTAVHAHATRQRLRELADTAETAQLVRQGDLNVETVLAKNLAAGDEITSWGVESYAGTTCKVTMRIINGAEIRLTLRPVSTNERFTVVVLPTTPCIRVTPSRQHRHDPIVDLGAAAEEVQP